MPRKKWGNRYDGFVEVTDRHRRKAKETKRPVTVLPDGSEIKGKAFVNYGRWEITDEVLADLERYAALGLTQEQIAYMVGIRPELLSKKKGSEERVYQALARGRAAGIARATESLVNQIDAGNTEATKFYLKNRDRENWADRDPVAQIQVNVSRMSDTQLVQEIRKDSALSKALANDIPLLDDDQAE